jgi:ATP-dependent helicase HrpB
VGRVAPGRVVRLYAESDFAARPVQAVPEVQRCDLSEAYLRLCAFGHHPGWFPWISPPDEASVLAVQTLLKDMGAPQDNGHDSTSLGQLMARSPCSPRVTRFLVAASQLGAGADAAIVAAMMSAEGSIFVDSARKANAKFADRMRERSERHGKLTDASGDHITALNVFVQWRALCEQETRR